MRGLRSSFLNPPTRVQLSLYHSAAFAHGGCPCFGPRTLGSWVWGPKPLTGLKPSRFQVPRILFFSCPRVHLRQIRSCLRGCCHAGKASVINNIEQPGTYAISPYISLYAPISPYIPPIYPHGLFSSGFMGISCSQHNMAA